MSAFMESNENKMSDGWPAAAGKLLGASLSVFYFLLSHFYFPLLSAVRSIAWLDALTLLLMGALRAAQIHRNRHKHERRRQGNWPYAPLKITRSHRRKLRVEEAVLKADSSRKADY
jgi:hypothetical protein